MSSTSSLFQTLLTSTVVEIWTRRKPPQHPVYQELHCWELSFHLLNFNGFESRQPHVPGGCHQGDSTGLKDPEAADVH